MSSYIINNTSLNKNKVFILQKSEFEKRWDPNSYYYERTDIIKALKKSSNKLEPLKFVTSFEKNIVKEIPENLPYLGLENIESNTGAYIQTTEKDSISSAICFKKGQVLFPKLRPYLNKVYFAEFDGVCSTEFHVFNSDKVSNEYLANFLRTNLIVNQTKYLMSGNTLPRLQTEDIESLLIPILSFENEQKVNNIMKFAHHQKQQNDAEAEKLLSSIDNYLLKELGITLPIQEENTLKSRMFTTSIKEISNSRFDPYYHTEYFKQIDKNLHQSKYTLLKLRSICNLQNGYAFKSNDYSLDETNTLNIRMSNIRPNNNFDADYNIRYLPDNYSEIFKEYLLNDGDILIAMTDMAADPKILGVPTIVKNSYNRNLLLNQRVGKLFDFDFSKIEINYLKEILGSAIVKAYYNKMGARGVQINISSEQILSAFIPVPPLEKQIEIADHISKIRQQAQELKDKTKLALQQANQEIENLLLN